MAGGRRRAAGARLLLGLLVLAIVLAVELGAGGGTVIASDHRAMERLKSLSIEDLANIKVSIVSRRPERLGDTPAAVFAITSEDLRRSGVTHIAEALRMVPGLNVARIDVSEWAVSARGFNGRFANKLLVLIDGRSVYTPLFSGVLWEAQDLFLADIERIEVIRGPGASIWGANAVNGVINIITKNAHDTTGTRAVLHGGNQERGAAARFGGQAGRTGAYRVYAKVRERDAMPPAAGSSGDWDSIHSGFRSDWNRDGTNRLTLQGGAYRDNSSELLNNGFNVVGRWEREHRSGTTSTLQSYFDRTDLDGRGNILDEVLETYDVEYRQHRAPSPRHNLVFGAGYRRTRSAITPAPPNDVSEATRTDHLFSAFIQDEIRLGEADWYLTVGSKFEENDYTGFEVQPGARLRWVATPSMTIWGSIARAVRTPSRAETDLIFETEVAPPSPATMGLPLVLQTSGRRRFQSETLMAYETGIRWQNSARLAIDATVFVNDYDDLRTLEIDPSPPVFAPTPTPRLVTMGLLENRLAGQTRGAEALFDWRPATRLRLQVAYSFLDMDLELDPSSTDPNFDRPEGESPEHQLSVRSLFDATSALEVDLWVRYVDELPSFGIDSYVTLDARIGWHPTSGLELSLVGRNLLESRHREFGVVLFTPGTGQLVEREAYVRLDWRF